MNRSIDPDVAVLLDALETPPLSADFSDRVLAAADAAGPARPSVAQASPRRDRRRSWMPRRLLIISAGAAMALAGVSAAATGLLSEWGVEIPVVTPFVTRHLGIHHRRHHAVTPGAQRAGTIKPPTVHTATAPPLQVATPVTSPLPDKLSPPPRLAFVHPHRWRDAGDGGVPHL